MRCRPMLLLWLLALGLMAGPVAGADDAKSSAPTKAGAKDDLYKDVPLPHGDPDPDPEDRTGVEVTLPSRPGHLGKQMDYGPYLAMSVGLGKRPEAIIERAFTIRLGHGVSAVYDMETLNLAGLWRGQFLDLSGTHYESMKGRHMARPGGKVAYADFNTPGWANAEGRFIDPREKALGPLPDAWINFKAHHLYEQRVILDYTVHGRRVLEMAGAAIPGDDRGEAKPNDDAQAWQPFLIVRRFEVMPGQKGLRVLLYQRGDGAKQKLVAGPSVAKINRHNVRGPKGSDGDEAAVVVKGDVAQLLWVINDNAAALDIRASEKPVRFTVWLALPEHRDARAAIDAEDDGRANLSAAISKAGKPRWKQMLTTEGTLGKDINGYAKDDIPLPDRNPYGSWMQPSAIGFFSDGRLALSTLNGDVWIASGLDHELKKVTWQRYATGFYQSLGLTVIDDEVYVTGRDRITRLVDVNADGEADSYHSVYDGGYVAPGYHAFAFGLRADKAGDLYFLRSGRKADAPMQNAMFKVDRRTGEAERIAIGFRHPNGMDIGGPNGWITVSDNQGEWIPSSKISVIREGRFYGYGGKRAAGDMPYDEPMLWLPQDMDNSSGGQAWTDAKRWGPLGGAMVHTSYGRCRLFYVLTDEVDGVAQAAAGVFAWQFESGVMRATVNPKDGQLYVAGLKGWDTRAKRDGCLARVRYTGQASHVATKFDVNKDGVSITFSQPLDAASVTPEAFDIEQWNYIYSKRYGSPHMSVKNPRKKGHDKVKVSRAALGDNGRTVRLTIDDFKPVNQMQISARLKTKAGGEFTETLYATINKLPQQ